MEEPLIISTLIVDDEPLARARLQRLLKQIDGVNVVAEASNGLEVLDILKRIDVDLILLDIEMPEMNGIDVAISIDETCQKKSLTPPSIIFCTAYNDYAISAFEANAVGYLLKPIDLNQLKSKIAGSARLSSLHMAKVKSLSLQQEDFLVLTSSTDYLKKILVSEISYFRSENKLVLAGINNEEVIVDDTLKQLEQRFSNFFIRVHRNSLINTACLYKLVKNDNGNQVIFLTNCDKQFIVSRRHLNSVKQCFLKASN